MTKQLTILFTLFLMPFFVSAEEFNAGFVKGLWYSEDVLFAETETRIYVALRNNTDSDLSGTVQFADNDTRIGSAFVKALPGRIIEAWVDWKPSYGDHRITATLTDVKLLTVGQPARQVNVESTIAEDVLFVDLDTDGDGVGNKEDQDDDADDVSDEDETRAGTDPLVPDKPKEKETEKDEEAEKDEIEAKKETLDERETNDTQNETPTQEAREGLERFTNNDGPIDGTLSKVTETVTETKYKLDEYREARNKDLEAKKLPPQQQVETTGTSTSGDTATITTTRIEPEKKKLIPYLFDGYKAIIDALYTFLLWFLSLFLGHPALVQFILLILIVYLIFKLARRLASRPKEYI